MLKGVSGIFFCLFFFFLLLGSVLVGLLTVIYPYTLLAYIIHPLIWRQGIHSMASYPQIIAGLPVIVFHGVHQTV
jgi:hypothetical protein